MGWDLWDGICGMGSAGWALRDGICGMGSTGVTSGKEGCLVLPYHTKESKPKGDEGGN